MSFSLIGGITFLGIVVVFGSALIASVLAAPWLPTRKKDLVRCIRALDASPGMLIRDLGAGDARFMLAVAAAHPEVRVDGYELSILPYLAGQVRIFFSPYRKRVRLRFGNFLTKHHAEVDRLFCFLTPLAMKKLATILPAELREQTKFVSYTFSVPGWTPVVEDRTGGTTTPIWVYDRSSLPTTSVEHP